MPNNKLSKNVYLENMLFPSSIECDATNRLCPISVHDDKDCCVCLLFFFRLFIDLRREYFEILGLTDREFCQSV